MCKNGFIKRWMLLKIFFIESNFDYIKITWAFFIVNGESSEIFEKPDDNDSPYVGVAKFLRFCYKS